MANLCRYIRFGALRSISNVSRTERKLALSSFSCIKVPDQCRTRGNSPVPQILPQLLGTSPFSTSSAVHSAPSEERYGYPIKDPVKGNLVYVGSLRNKVKFIKLFSITTSVFAIGLQPFLYKSAQTMPIWLKAIAGGMVNFFIFITPVVLHFITKRYVVNMYYDNATNHFTATSYSLFLQEIKTTFTPEDVEIPTIPGPFTSVVVKGRPMLVIPEDFFTREAYIKFMSYDKPLEWELPPDEDKDKEDKHKSS